MISDLYMGIPRPFSIVIDTSFRVVVAAFRCCWLAREAKRMCFIFAPAQAAPEVPVGSKSTSDGDVFSEALVIRFARAGRHWMSCRARDVQIYEGLRVGERLGLPADVALN
jgi:hypothetical protein